MLNKSLTIVLPIHNGENRLRKCVGEILELASELTARFHVLIIDNGSTDATYEVAEELAARYPQVTVERSRHCREVSRMIEHIQRHIRTDAIIVHDGVAPIDPTQVRSLWRKCLIERAAGDNSVASSALLQYDICDLANLPAIHAAMERAHNRVLGFQWITPVPAERAAAGLDLAGAADRVINEPRTDPAHARRRSGMGSIPALPRPRFLSILTEFALGE